MDFLAESYAELQTCIRGLRDSAAAWPEESRQQFETALELLDWDYLEEEIPLAIEQSLDGVRRVSSLVLAMKQFSHPSGKELAPGNVHDVITTALTVTRNEWKYVAEVETDFAENVPQIPLLVDEFGQVVLNLIINGVHAITERQQVSGEEVHGLITIRTACTETMVEIQFQDNGMGMPENVVAKVFDPFFTTKEVGKGTGQGLAISRDVIVKKHGGTITVRSEQGVGTTFTIRLPRTATRREISENL